MQRAVRHRTTAELQISQLRAHYEDVAETQPARTQQEATAGLASAAPTASAAAAAAASSNSSAAASASTPAKAAHEASSSEEDELMEDEPVCETCVQQDLDEIVSAARASSKKV